MAADPENAFQEAISRVFEGWSVLHLAVDNGFGGPESVAKARWMVRAVDQWFQENRDLDPSEVEEFLADVMDHEFNTVVDDGSLVGVSRSICECFQLIASQRLDQLRDKLERMPRASSQGHQRVADDADEDEESSEDEESTMEMDNTASTPSACASSSTSHNIDSMDTTDTGAREGSSQQQQQREPGNQDKDDGWTVVKKGKKR